MSRIGRKPVRRAGQREGLGRRLDDPRRRAQGQALVHLPARDRRPLRRGRQAGRSSPAATTSGENRALHGLTRSLIANMVAGRHHRLHQEAGDRRRRLPGPAEEGEHGRPPGRLRQPGRARGPAGGQRRRSPTRPTSRSPAPTSRRSASSPPRSARSAPPSRTRARASATRARSSAARPARRSARSNPASRSTRAIDRDVEGLGVRSASAAPEPRSDRKGPSGESAQTRRKSAGCGGSGTSASGSRDARAAPPGRLPQLEAHLRPGRSTTTPARPWPRPARSTPRSASSRPTAATRRPPRSSAARRRAGQAGRY